jgi:hypothetical protein
MKTIKPQSPALPKSVGEKTTAPSAGTFVIFYNNCPVHLTANVRGKVWSVCHLSEATVFESQEQAARAAFAAGISSRLITIKPTKTKVVPVDWVDTEMTCEELAWLLLKTPKSKVHMESDSFPKPVTRIFTAADGVGNLPEDAVMISFAP